MILYVVVREIGFHGGAKVSIPLEGFEREEDAIKNLKGLSGAMEEVLKLSLVQMTKDGRANDVGQTVQDVLADMGVLEYQHTVIKMKTDVGESNVVSIDGGGIILPA